MNSEPNFELLAARVAELRAGMRSLLERATILVEHSREIRRKHDEQRRHGARLPELDPKPPQGQP